MKILVNRKIKQLFLYVLLAVVAFTAASVLIICLGLKNAALYVAIAAVLMTLIISIWRSMRNICPIMTERMNIRKLMKVWSGDWMEYVQIWEHQVILIGASI